MNNYTIKDAFMDVYSDCKVDTPIDYTLGNIKSKSYIIYCVDKICEKQPVSGLRCDDFIVFDESKKTVGIFLIERKAGSNSNAGKACRQLQGGANFIKDFSKNKHASINNLFYLPVLVSKRASRSMLNTLKTTMVTLNNQRKYIRHVRIGESLPER